LHDRGTADLHVFQTCITHWDGATWRKLGTLYKFRKDMGTGVYESGNMVPD
jgi:hypothetical protein